MKKNKRVIVALTALLVLNVFSFGTYAKITDKMTADLNAYGILKDERFEDKITRAEFSAMIVRLLKIDTSSYPIEKSPFVDVNEDDWFYNEINIMKSIKIIDGYNSTEFRPFEDVTYEQAVKIVVCALGYKDIAESKGGYPDGYISVASSLNLLNGVGSDSGVMLRENAARLVYNALDVSLITYDYTGGMTTDSDNTLRKIHETLADGREIIVKKGVITANYELGLVRSIPNIKENQVEINGEIFNAGDTNAAELVGMKVEYHAITGDDSVPTLLNVRVTDDNSVLSINGSDFDRVDGKTLYYTENGKDEKLSLSENKIYVRNYDVVSGYTDKDITLKNGSMTLVDNDGDESYDIIFVEEYENIRAEKYENGKVFFAENRTFEGSTLIDIDEDNDIKYILLASQTESIALDKAEEYIKENSILSMLFSADKTVLKIIVTNKTAEGKIEQYSEEDNNITIGGETYDMTENVISDAAIGDNVTAYLDFGGKVCEIKRTENGEKKYAYVIAAKEKNGISGTIEIKVLVPGELKADIKIDDSDEDNTTSLPILKGHNSGIEVLTLRDRVSFGGKSLKGDKLIEALNDNRLIRYTLDSNGEISKIEIPERTGTGEQRTYNAYEKIFGKTGTGAFAIDDNSVGICLPKNEINTEDDYYTEIELNNGEKYSVKGYNVDENTHCAEIIVLTLEMDSSIKEAINDSSDPAIVCKVTTELNDEETAAKKVVFLSEGKEMTKFVSPGSSADSELLETGTVFYYAENFKGDIVEVKTVEHLKGNNGIYSEGSPTTEQKILGEMIKVTPNQLSDNGNRFVYEVLLNTGLSDYETLNINVRNTPPIFVYNERTNTVRCGTLEDIVPTWRASGSAVSKIFAEIRYSKVKAVVVTER